jgi:carbamate kinase
MRVVVALGGDALLRRDQPLSVSAQRTNVGVAVAAIAELATRHDVIVTQGNGPQVGLLALQSEAYSGEPTPTRAGSRPDVAGRSPLTAPASGAS